MIIRDPSVADQAGDSNAFESDNDASGSEATPKTAPKFANITAVLAPGEPSSKYRSATRLRRSTELSIYNSAFVGPFPKGIELQDKVADNYKAGKMKLEGIILQGPIATFSGVDQTIFDAAANKNKVYTAVADLMLDTNFNTLSARPVLVPKAGSPLLSGGATLPAGFDATAYRGAFGAMDWTTGWANFDPQNTTY